MCVNLKNIFYFTMSCGYDKTYTIANYNFDIDTEECPICFDSYKQNEEVVLLHGNKKNNMCKHNMCIECFKNYKSETCHICRGKF